MKDLRFENKDKLSKLNLPNFKSKQKVMILDKYAAYSLDCIEIDSIINYEDKHLGMHGTYAAQIIKLIGGDNIDFYTCRYYELEECINYCIENNIKIISASINFMYSEENEMLLKKYYDFGGVFITSAGNEENNDLGYSASSPYTICVSATNTGDCDGSEINVTSDSYWYVRNKQKNMYHSFNGTSASAPVISGCVALLLEKYPNYNMEQVKKFLYDNSTTNHEDLEEYERFFSFPDNFKLEVNDMFKDIEDHWAKEDIEYCVNKGYVNGFEDGTFRPDEPLTRAQYCHLLRKLEGDC